MRYNGRTGADTGGKLRRSQLPLRDPTPLGIPAHLQGEVSLADIHSGLAVVGIQVEQEVICRVES